MRLLVSVSRRASVDWLPETSESVAAAVIAATLNSAGVEVTAAPDTAAPNDWWAIFDARKVSVPWENGYLDREVTLGEQQYRATAEKP